MSYANYDRSGLMTITVSPFNLISAGRLGTLVLSRGLGQGSRRVIQRSSCL